MSIIIQEFIGLSHHNRDEIRRAFGHCSWASRNLTINMSGSKPNHQWHPGRCAPPITVRNCVANLLLRDIYGSQLARPRDPIHVPRDLNSRYLKVQNPWSSSRSQGIPRSPMMASDPSCGRAVIVNVLRLQPYWCASAVGNAGCGSAFDSIPQRCLRRERAAKAGLGRDGRIEWKVFGRATIIKRYQY